MRYEDGAWRETDTYKAIRHYTDAIADPNHPANTDPDVEDTIDGWTKTASWANGLDRHPDSQKFHDRLKAAGEMHDRKQADYGTTDDPFANIRRCERYDIPAWVGCAIRMADKMARIERAVGQWARGEKVSMSNESLLDSFDDLSVYAIIGAILYEDEKEKS